MGSNRTNKSRTKRTTVFRYFNCKCECGIIKPVRACDLKNGRSTQCRDCRDKVKYTDTSIMIGKKYGEWLVISVGELDGKSRRLLCRCKCGKERLISASDLNLGRSTICHMCNVTKHGYEKTSTYNTWRCMKARCENKKHENYLHYGARGITVCERWHNFINFLEDMGEKPTGYQIDRINNNGNYEPGNCKWVTPKENSNNRRKRPVLWNKK